jgi:hypothetical protein
MTDRSLRLSRELVTDPTPEHYSQLEMDSSDSDSDSDFDTLDDLSSLCLSDVEPGDEPQVENRSYLRGIVDMGRQVTLHFEVAEG